MRSLLVFLLLVMLVGCGKRGDIEPPPYADPSFPRSYPAVP